MNIAFLIDDITHGGGTERVTSVLANAFSKKHSISIFSIRTSEECKYELDKRVKIISFNGEKHKNKMIQRLKTGKQVLNNCLTSKIDVLIVVETYKFLNLLPVIKKMKKNRIKVITWEHFNFYIDKKWSIKWFGRFFSTKYSDSVVVLGKEDLQNYKKNLKIKGMIDYIYNPIFCEKSEQKDTSKHKVLAVGRLEDQKGFDYLLNIWSLIEKKKKYGDWILQIVGNGSKEKELYKRIEDLNLQNVEMIPFQKDIDKFYEGASIFVLSSRYEGFGLVLLEAFAHRLPAVSFDIKEGPKEIIDNNVNGYLVKPFDLQEYACKLESLMENDNKRKEFSNQTQKDLDRFDIKNVVWKWEELFKKMGLEKYDIRREKLI